MGQRSQGALFLTAGRIICLQNTQTLQIDVKTDHGSLFESTHLQPASSGHWMNCSFHVCTFYDSAPESVNIHRCLSCIQGNVGSVVGKGDNKVWNKKKPKTH